MSQYKRRFDGAPPSEKRRIGTDSTVEIRKLPPHKQPREYVLTTIETTTTVYRSVNKYKTKAQMDAGKVAIRKRIDDERAKRFRWRWRDEVKTHDVEFEEQYPGSAPETQGEVNGR